MTELATIANVSPDPAIRNTPIGSRLLSPLIRDIVRLVAIYYRLSPAEIVGRSRRKAPLRARQMAVLLAHKFTGKSSVFIGRFIGQRDHTTILWSLRRMEARVESDTVLASEYRDLYDCICAEYGL